MKTMDRYTRSDMYLEFMKIKRGEASPEEIEALVDKMYLRIEACYEMCFQFEGIPENGPFGNLCADLGEMLRGCLEDGKLTKPVSMRME
jgi:hypothetical protein